MSNLKSTALHGVKWQLLHKITMQPVGFLYGIALARLITPEEMGILGMAAFFFAIAGQLISCGLGSALIQAKDRTKADESTVFWLNLILGTAFSLLLFLLAPALALFFEKSDLTGVVQFSAVTMFVSALTAVHTSMFHVKCDFKTPAIINMISALCTMALAITLALLQYSFWSVCIGGLVAACVNSLLLWKFSTWRPAFIFSKKSFHKLFSFGNRVLIGGLIESISANFRTLLIGKYYSTADLAFYNKGNQMANFAPTTAMSVIGQVIFPLLSQLQNEPERHLESFKKITKMSSSAIIFLCALLIAVADPLILFLYGADWMGAIPYVRIFCITLLILNIGSQNFSLLLSKGRSDVTMRLQIISACQLIPISYIAIQYSALAIALSMIITSCINITLNLYSVSRVFDYPIRTQITNVGIYYPLAGLSVLPSYLISLSDIPLFFQLTLGGLSAVTLYIICLYWRDDYCYKEYIEIIKKNRIVSHFLKRR